MLKDDLFSIISLNKDADIIESLINLKASHTIFEGHFPQQPVLPGVCIMQMGREILEYSLNAKLQLLRADDIRFFSMINPAKHALLKFLIQYNSTESKQINVNAKVLNLEDIICCKMKAVYIIRV